MDPLVFVILFTVFSTVGWMFVDRYLRKRRRRKAKDAPPESVMPFSLVQIDPSSLGGIVKVSEEFAERFGISSGAAGRLYRSASDTTVRRKGFGEKRALQVMIGVDESLKGRQISIGEEEANILRMGGGAVVFLGFTTRNVLEHPRMELVRGKVRTLESGFSEIIVERKPPHKVRVPSKLAPPGDKSRNR